MAYPTDPHRPGAVTSKSTHRPTQTRAPSAPPSDEVLRQQHLRNRARLHVEAQPDQPKQDMSRLDIAWLDRSNQVQRYTHSARRDFGFEDICGAFARGTLIESEAGPIAIEDVEPGTRLRTLDNGFKTVVWVASCRPDFESEGLSEDLRPIRIRSDAMGDLRPDGDLIVSSRFRFLLTNASCRTAFGQEEMLAPVRAYVDGDMIAPLYRAPGLEFFNLMFDRHQIVRANGLLTESFHPGTYGMATMPPDVRRAMMALFPHLEGDMAAFGPVARGRLRAFEAATLRGVA